MYFFIIHKSYNSSKYHIQYFNSATGSTCSISLPTSSCGVTTTTQASQPKRRVSGGVSGGVPGKGGVGEFDFYPVPSLTQARLLSGLGTTVLLLSQIIKIHIKYGIDFGANIPQNEGGYKPK